MLGGTIAFSVSVDQECVFQWRFGGVNIPGATAQTFVLPNAQLSNAGQYQVTASNIFGVSTSAVAVRPSICLGTNTRYGRFGRLRRARSRICWDSMAVRLINGRSPTTRFRTIFTSSPVRAGVLRIT